MQERGIDMRMLSPEAIDNIMTRYEERIDKDYAYIKRLEAAFLKMYVYELMGGYMPRKVAEEHAREALEKIRSGGKDEESMAMHPCISNLRIT